MERLIKWTEECLNGIESTLDFYDQRNGSTQYSRSLYSLILLSAKRIAINPMLGHSTEYPHVRYWVMNQKFSLFYHHNEACITILLLWDNRRNPSRLTYILKSSNSSYLNEELVSYGEENSE